MALRHRIHDAAKKGSIDDVARLLKENPELINDKGEDEWTPLFRACYNGRLSMVQFLVENGASLSRGSDEWENSPLHACAINGHRDVAEYLIANNADVNSSENYGSWTPLYAASYFGWPEMIELLLKAGADPSIKSKEGHTALDVVCEAGYRQENRDAIVAMLKNKPVPVGHTWKKNRPTPTRLSVTSVTTPGVPVNYSNPPPYSENRTGSRIYFPWELHNSDYARRALDSLQELLLWLFKTASDVGVLEEPGCASNPFKPCLDAYDLLLLAEQRTDALARFLATHPMSPRQPQDADAVACEIEEGAKVQAVEEGLRARIETVGAAAHRASYGKDDVEGLIKEVTELAKVVGGVGVAEDLQLLLAQFTAHSGSKCARLRFLRATHRLDPSVDEEPAPLGGGNKGTQTPRFDAYGEVCLTGNGSG